MKLLRCGILMLLSLLLMLPSFGIAEQAASRQGALSCSFTAPEETQTYTSHLSDGDPVTTLTLKKGESLRMQIEGGTANALFFDFYETPQPFTLTFEDASGTVTDKQDLSPAGVHLLLPLSDANVAAVTLKAANGDVRLCEWLACGADFVPPFPDTDAEADVLAVLNEPGDELTLFGGLFAMLAGEHGLSVQVVYLTAADGFRMHQCMQVLSGMGVRRAPVFYGGSKTKYENDGAVLKALGGEKELMNRLCGLIETVRPKVLLTLDPAQSQERFANGVIARTVLAAAARAESDGFKVQKVYTLSPDGKTTVALNVPLYAFDGTPADTLSETLAAFYTEDRVYRRTLPDTLRVSLASSAVGTDQNKNDLLEHLPSDAFKHYQAPTPTPAPTPEPTEAPTPEPTETPRIEPAGTEPTPLEPLSEEPTEVPANPTAAPEKTPAAEPQKDGFSPIVVLPAVIGAVLALVLFMILRKKGRGVRVLSLLLPLLVGVLVSLALFILRKDAKAPAESEAPVQSAAPSAEAASTPTSKSAETPTPDPTEAPTQKPTEAPTPEPTEAPTPEPTPDPNDAYFLSGDGEEYNLDFDSGKYWYKSSVLSVEAEQVNTKYKDGKPLVYYVADIRMRTYSSFRSGLYDKVVPWKYARAQKAVLAITGDNLVDAEKEQKGCLIRQGLFYSDFKRAETLAIVPESMTLEVLHPGTFTARELMDRGVRDTFGFGPILVENGGICDSVYTHRIKHPNPRCGIGMVEPGHWVAIVSDGRQAGYSQSISLEYFAQLFIDRGCVCAYNLDGGSSAGMVFMGESLNKHLGPGTDDTQRWWIDSLMFGYSEQVPDESVKTTHDGLQHK